MEEIYAGVGGRSFSVSLDVRKTLDGLDGQDGQDCLDVQDVRNVLDVQDFGSRPGICPTRPFRCRLLWKEKHLAQSLPLVDPGGLCPRSRVCGGKGHRRRTELAAMARAYGHRRIPDRQSTRPMDDKFDASPAAVGKKLFLRGRQNLYCLAEK